MLMENASALWFSPGPVTRVEPELKPVGVANRMKISTWLDPDQWVEVVALASGEPSAGRRSVDGARKLVGFGV